MLDFFKKYTIEEQKENRSLFVATLKGNEYERCETYLRNHDTFCILGVACDVSNLHEWRKNEG